MQQRSAPKRNVQRGRPFVMPPQKATRPQMVGRRRDAHEPVRRRKPAHAKNYTSVTDCLKVAAFVFGGYLLMTAFVWVYGHFRWGWTL